ncbi:hypothetical protein DYU05_09815 [Mucilaginibacter terrenus]|uniref:Glycosyl-4,4'-diaponeurosporenoate acyltransferase n=1 Tax=Mucilaginibacter terrenus TaxID=2482727 RepID=A0A3E2NXZ1_9SPHI|nr:hypothetical protein [Mucilaginibacter terrenus]RFZ85863.1 hypothetical protein DYU05_09815 [Mucilaginibacter terrenus]
MNQAINAFWTALAFIPIFAFWSRVSFMPWFYVFIAIATAALFIPARLIQLSSRTRFYESLGVKTIRKLVQNGDLVNRLIRKKNPNYKVVKDRAAAVKYLRSVTMYERFHFFFFIYFLLVAGYAISLYRHQLAAIILVMNIIYNVCPMLLHQYNKLRISRLKKASFSAFL